jgi:hypothetical protein
MFTITITHSIDLLMISIKTRMSSKKMQTSSWFIYDKKVFPCILDNSVDNLYCVSYPEELYFC